jgi:hypothetical protein
MHGGPSGKVRRPDQVVCRIGGSRHSRALGRAGRHGGCVCLVGWLGGAGKGGSSRDTISGIVSAA